MFYLLNWHDNDYMEYLYYTLAFKELIRYGCYFHVFFFGKHYSSGLEEEAHIKTLETKLYCRDKMSSYSLNWHDNMTFNIYTYSLWVS